MLIVKQIDENEIYQSKIKRLQKGQTYFISTKQYTEATSSAVKTVWVEAKFKQVSGVNQRILWFERYYESSIHMIHKAILTINTIDYLLNECQILTPKEFYEMKEKRNNDIEKIIYDIRKGENKK